MELLGLLTLHFTRLDAARPRLYRAVSLVIPEHLAGARLPRGARELTSLHEHSHLSHTKSPEHQVPGWAVTSWGYSRTARIFSFCRPVGAACSSVRGLPAKLSGCLTHTTGSWPPQASLRSLLRGEILVARQGHKDPGGPSWRRGRGECSNFISSSCELFFLPLSPSYNLPFPFCSEISATGPRSRSQQASPLCTLSLSQAQLQASGVHDLAQLLFQAHVQLHPRPRAFQDLPHLPTHSSPKIAGA